MAEASRPQKPLDEREQAAYYFARERRKSNFDPTFKLFRTDIYADGAQIPIAAFSSVTSSPVAFKVRVRVDTLATANGVVFEIGTGTANLGIAVYLDGGDVGFAARGLTALVIPDAFLADGQERLIVAAISAGGTQIWCDELTDFQSYGGASNIFPWAGVANGEVGGIDGTVVGGVPAGQRVALTDASIVSPLSVYRRQRPRCMVI